MTHPECVSQHLCYHAVLLVLFAMFQGFTFSATEDKDLALFAHRIILAHASLLFGMAISTSLLDYVSQCLWYCCKMAVYCFWTISLVATLNQWWGVNIYSTREDLEGIPVYQQLLFGLASISELLIIPILFVLLRHFGQKPHDHYA